MCVYRKHCIFINVYILKYEHNMYLYAICKKYIILNFDCLNFITGIEYDDEMTKKNLFEKISINRPPRDQQYSIDKVMRNAGHEVIRLPPYHCELNPIELAWGFCKKYVERKTLYSTNGKGNSNTTKFSPV